MNPQTYAKAAGVLFLITFISAIPAQLVLYDAVLNDADYIIGAGIDNGVSLGALLELILIIANIGTALALFPILRRQNESLALGYVAARIIECVFIAVGILSLLTVMTLRSEAVDAETGSLLAIGETLVAIHDWTFLLGPGFVVGVGNGLLLGYLMYRSGLVPRRMALLGLVGGPLVCASGIGVMFDVFEAGSGWQIIATLPEIAWELSLGIYLTVKGFKPAPIIAMDAAAGTQPANLITSMGGTPPPVSAAQGS